MLGLALMDQCQRCFAGGEGGVEDKRTSFLPYERGGDAHRPASRIQLRFFSIHILTSLRVFRKEGKCFYMSRYLLSIVLCSI